MMNNVIGKAVRLGLAAMVVVLGALLASAELSENPNPKFWVTDGWGVYAIALTENTIYIGGEFTRVSPQTGSGAAIDTTSGLLVPGFPEVDGLILAVISDGTGGWYIGGLFSSVGGADRNNIAHILSDGSVDPAWDPNADGSISSLVISGDGATVYAGGNFTQIGGQSRSNIAALDPTIGYATSWNPGTNGFVSALVMSPNGTTLYLAGAFTSVGGQWRNYIGAVDALSGNVTPWDPRADGDVVALAVSPDGATVYAGGIFMAIGNQVRNNIAALETSTGNATAWNPDANWGVLALALSPDGTIVYAAGGFTEIGGWLRNRIAALDALTGNAMAWDPDARGAVIALAVSPDGTTVYAGGEFAWGEIGGHRRKYIAALDASTGNATAWDPGANGIVYALALSQDGTALYVAGGFTQIGGQVRNNIAALDAATGQVTALNPNVDGPVYSLAMSPDDTILYVGGPFTSIGGQERNGIAAVNVLTGNVTAWNPNASGGWLLYPYVSSLAVSPDGTTIYAVGVFTSIGGQERNYIAALDAVTGNATAWNPNPDSEVRAVALSADGNTVYVGGDFTSIGGLARKNIASLYASTGNVTAWNPIASGSPYPYVDSLAVSADGSTVYVGGNFDSIGGQARNNIAALDASTGHATSWDPNPNGGVFSLAISPDGSTVYPGGGFSYIGSENRSNIAALDASTGNATAWDPGANGIVYALALSQDGKTLCIGGGFTSIGSRARDGFAVFDEVSVPTPTPTPTATPTPTPTPVSPPYTFNFDTGADGWIFSGTIIPFDSGAQTSSGGHLGLSPSGSSYCFGFWNSPEISVHNGVTYKAEFSLASSLSTGELVPQCRLRANQVNGYGSATREVISGGDGGGAPLNTPRTYDLLFTPLFSGAEGIVTLSFDILNFDPSDDGNAWIYLESVTIEEVSVSP